MTDSIGFTGITGLIVRLLKQLKEYPDFPDTQIMLDKYEKTYPKYYKRALEICQEKI